MTLVLALVLVVEPQSDTPVALQWSPRVEVPVTIGLGLAWVITEFALKKPLAPAACHWCRPNDFDTSIRRVFNPSLTPSVSGFAGPDTASTILGLVVLPAALFGLDALLENDGSDVWVKRWATDLVLIAEATFAAMAVNQLVKFTVGRARPFTVGEAPELLAGAADRADQNVSFFSGHTTFVVSMAVSAGVVSTLRRFRFGWVTWAVGVPLAVATAVLRLAADKHWASDVIVGAAVAGAFSVAIPLLFHQPQTVNVAPYPGGLSLSGSF